MMELIRMTRLPKRVVWMPGRMQVSGDW